MPRPRSPVARAAKAERRAAGITERADRHEGRRVQEVTRALAFAMLSAGLKSKADLDQVVARFAQLEPEHRGRVEAELLATNRLPEVLRPGLVKLPVPPAGPRTLVLP